MTELTERSIGYSSRRSGSASRSTPGHNLRFNPARRRPIFRTLSVFKEQHISEMRLFRIQSPVINAAWRSNWSNWPKLSNWCHLRPRSGHLRPRSGHLRPRSEHLRPRSEHLRHRSEHLRHRSEHLRPDSRLLRPSPGSSWSCLARPGHAWLVMVS